MKYKNFWIFKRKKNKNTNENKLEQRSFLLF